MSNQQEPTTETIDQVQNAINTVISEGTFYGWRHYGNSLAQAIEALHDPELLKVTQSLVKSAEQLEMLEEVFLSLAEDRGFDVEES